MEFLSWLNFFACSFELCDFLIIVFVLHQSIIDNQRIWQVFLPQNIKFHHKSGYCKLHVFTLVFKCTIKFLLEITFLTSRIVLVVSLLPISSNSCLILELRNLMISLTSSSFLPSSSLTLWIASIASLIKSFYSKTTWMDGQISLAELMILAHSYFFAWASGSFNVSSFFNIYILSVNLFGM